MAQNTQSWVKTETSKVEEVRELSIQTKIKQQNPGGLNVLC